MKNLLKDLRSDYFAIYPFSIVLKYYLNRLPIRKLFIPPIYFLAFLLTSCLNDTITQNQNHLSNGHNKNIKYVSISEIPGIIPNIQEFNRSYNFLSSSFQSTNRSVENLNLDLNKILVYTKSDSLKSYSITILNTLEASETYYFENLHIIEKETTNEILIFRWTPNNKEIPFNSKTFSGNLKVFDKNYQLITSKSFANGTSDPVSDEYQMGCDILVDCNCPGDPWCGCDGSYPNCVNSFTLFCTLGGGGSGGGNSGSGGTGSGGSSGGGGSGSGNSGTGNPPSEPTIEDANNGILAVIPIKPNTIEEPEIPCLQLAKLCNFKTVGNITPNLNLLKTAVEAPNNNKEKGFEIEKKIDSEGNEKYVATPATEANEFSIVLNIGGNFIIGGLHSHPKRGVPVPSFGDLKWLRDCYLATTRVERRPLIFSMVVCNNPTTQVTNTYALKISNFNALNTMINSVWNNPDYAEYATDDEKMDAIHFDEATQYEENNNEYQRVFLQKYGTPFGIDLFDANASYTNWSKLSLSNPTTPNPTVISTPCN